MPTQIFATQGPRAPDGARVGIGDGSVRDCSGVPFRIPSEYTPRMKHLACRSARFVRAAIVAAALAIGCFQSGFAETGSAALSRGQESVRIDRVLAVVNGEPITYSEVLEAAALMPGGGPSLTVEETLERLIDARLMEREARRYPQEPPSEEESEATLRALMDRFPTPDEYRATLRRLGIAEDYLRKRIQRELIVDRYVDRRFRPLVQVAQRDVEEYYRTVLLPDLDAGSPATLTDVESLIRNILEQRDLNRRISAWLEELKSSASIVRLPLSEPPPVG